MELWRVSISRGLLELVLFRMGDGKEWCAPELSDGEQPLKCKKLVLLQRRVGDRAVPESWTTTVPLKNVLNLLSNVEQTRLKLTPQRREQGTLFLVSMEALSELLHHTPRPQGQGLGSWSYLQHHRGAPHAGRQPFRHYCT
jgi:hypothetical protein